MGAATNGTPKQFLEWRGRPLYWHSARTFCRSGAVRGLIFVFPAADFELAVEDCRAIAAEEDPGLPWMVVPGGARRQDSVRHGLEALPQDCTHVLVHDAARPFLSAALVHRVLAGLERAPAVVPGLRMTDTVKCTPTRINMILSSEPTGPVLKPTSNCKRKESRRFIICRARRWTCRPMVG